MSVAIEKESGESHELHWKGLRLEATVIKGLITGDGTEPRKLDNRNNSHTGIFAIFFKNRIISVYYDIDRNKVGVWDVRRDKS